jgi:DNA-binding SARP family transcriptional activator
VQFATRKAEQLFAYLILHRNTHHTRDELAGLWWADHDTRRARHCLNTTLWRLRQALGPAPGRGSSYLNVSPELISFNEDSDFWLDVDEFEHLSTQVWPLAGEDSEAAGQALQRAASLYQGDLLPGCYEEWCLLSRQRLQQSYMTILSRLAAFHTRRHEFAPAIAALQNILVLDPLREEIHRDLIRLFIAAARPQQAVRQYQACAQILWRELGTEPMPETAALVRRFHETALPPGAGSPSPAPVGSASASPAAAAEFESILADLASVLRSVALVNLQAEHILQRLEQLYNRGHIKA